MSAVSGTVGAFMGADAQKDAAETSANASVQAAQISTDAMLKMWEQSQKDWEPYLNAGYQGITSLQTQMPKYMQETVMPAYNNYMKGLGVAQYDPRAFTVDPVTGQVGGDYTGGDANTLYNVNRSSYQVPSNYTAQGNGMYRPQASPQGNTFQRQPQPQTYNAQGLGNAFTGLTSGIQQQKTIDEQTANKLKWQGAVKDELQDRSRSNNNAQMQNVLTASTSPNNVNINGMSAKGYAPTQNASLTQGGVLSPLTPTLEGKVDFNWNQNDPIYQYKLQQAQDAARQSLAKQGLLDSRAGVNTLSDTALRVGAEDIDKQYARQVAERDYLTQKAMSEYQMQAQRGDTLYGRLTGQQNALYAGLQGNQDNAIARLGQAYGLGNSLYNQVYGHQIDLTKVGTNASGSAGANSMATGQQIGQNALYAGNAQASAAQQMGQANAALWSGLGGMGGNAAATYMQFAPQNTGSYYGGNSGGSFYGGYGNAGGYGGGMGQGYTPGAWG